MSPGKGHFQPQQETSLHKVFTPEGMVTSGLSELTPQSTPRKGFCPSPTAPNTAFELSWRTVGQSQDCGRSHWKPSPQPDGQLKVSAGQQCCFHQKRQRRKDEVRRSLPRSDQDPVGLSSGHSWPEGSRLTLFQVSAPPHGGLCWAQRQAGAGSTGWGDAGGLAPLKVSFLFVVRSEALLLGSRDPSEAPRGTHGKPLLPDPARCGFLQQIRPWCLCVYARPVVEAYFLSPGCDPASQDACHLSVDFSPSCLLAVSPSSHLQMASLGCPRPQVCVLSLPGRSPSQSKADACGAPSWRAERNASRACGQRKILLLHGCGIRGAVLSSPGTIFTSERQLLSGGSCIA